MAQPGTRPTPTAIKALTGAARKDPQRLNKSEPKPPVGKLRCPPQLDREGKAAWRRTYKHLCDMKIMSPAYEDSLLAYAEAWSKYRAALAQVNLHGLAIERVDSKGQTEIIRNPYSVEVHKWWETCFKLLTEFGLTPSSKTRVSVVKDDDEVDPLVEIFRRRQQRATN